MDRIYLCIGGRVVSCIITLVVARNDSGRIGLQERNVSSILIPMLLVYSLKEPCNASQSL